MFISLVVIINMVLDMKTILVVGLGRVGYRTFTYLKELYPDASFLLVDIDKRKLRAIGKVENVETYEYAPGILGKLGERADVAVTALPSTIAMRCILELVGHCINVVDVSFIKEDPYVLNKVVEDCFTYLVVDAGFAPGYSNIVAGYAYHELGLNEDIEIAVGGIPEKPIPPIGYTVTWSARDLLEEYVRPARLIENHEVKAVNPLEYVRTIEIPSLGSLEAFASDGLRTMLRNIKARNLRELTLRWPGHLSAMKLLHDLGFLDEVEIEVEGVKVKPVDFTATILEKKLSLHVNDLAILQVLARSDDGKYYREIAILPGKPENPATPVFTALVHAYTVKIALDKKIKPGVIAPEELYTYKHEYEEFLANKGVLIRKDSNIPGP